MSTPDHAADTPTEQPADTLEEQPADALEDTLEEPVDIRQEQQMDSSNVHEVLEYVQSDVDIPAHMLRDTLIRSLTLLSAVQAKAQEYGSLAQTLRDSNAELKEMISKGEEREKELQTLHVQVSVPKVDTEELELLRERMMIQREEYERRIKHLKAVSGYIRRV